MADRKLLFRPAEAADALAVSRARLYTWIASGELPSVKLGASRRIEVHELERFVQRLKQRDTEAANSSSVPQTHLPAYEPAQPSRKAAVASSPERGPRAVGTPR